jgi:hypothetical protein
MSLIVDINPVPWKILDLVKARILKNRAKKAKKGLDWSKETLRREMALTPAPLISRKRDEPSFINSPRVLTFTIEGRRTVVNTELGQPLPRPPLIYDEWNVYYQDEQLKGTPSRSLLNRFFVPTGSPNYFEGAFFINNYRNLTSKFYVSFFSDLGSGDSLTPVMVLISSATVDSPSSWTKSIATLSAPYSFINEEPEEEIIRLNEIAENDNYNPLHNWPDPKIYEPGRFLNVVNRLRPPVPQIPLPLAAEFDESRIAQIPGYIKTIALELTGTSNQLVSTIVES